MDVLLILEFFANTPFEFFGVFAVLFFSGQLVLQMLAPLLKTLYALDLLRKQMMRRSVTALNIPDDTPVVAYRTLRQLSGILHPESSNDFVICFRIVGNIVFKREGNGQRAIRQSDVDDRRHFEFSVCPEANASARPGRQAKIQAPVFI